MIQGNSVLEKNDEFTKKSIVDQLYWDSRVNAADVQVEVRGGKVSLTGKVPDYNARGAASEIAVETDGVHEVNNHIAVIPETRVKDETILRNARNVLAWDSSLANCSFGLSISNGTVEIEGVVDACWKKHKAEKLVGNLMGVKTVDNRIAIAPSGDFLDQTVAEKAMEVLRKRFPVKSPNIMVAVSEGIATLSGTLPSWSDAKRAVSAVEHIRGIAGVKNELVITDIS